MATPQKLKRKENWSRAEQEVLRNAYFDENYAIDSKFCPGITHCDKDKSWKIIVERVNAQGVCVRTLDECKKTLSDIKTDVKRRERRRRQMTALTGGGPPPKLDAWEEKMIQLIGDSAIGGFAGVDTFALNTSSPSPIKTAECALPVESGQTTSNKVSPSLPLGTAMVQKSNTRMTTLPLVGENSNSDKGAVNIERLLMKQNELLNEILQQQKITNDLMINFYTLKQ
ncbi:uncharacterized protein LOC128241359 [Mya arenaria]|uniref:uncharacterized protein LOC128241359 n=1 Tax=Mya arenaria TaxID=6604 RepID=UPI0022E33962|nr:uncharacterized protein LOC128241359 [Mya arenaria]